MRQREKQAQQELEESRRMLEQDRRRYVEPLEAQHSRNKFSDMIRDALQVGYGEPPPGERRLPGE